MSNEITHSFTPQVFGYLICFWYIAGCRAHGGECCGLGPCPLGSKMLARRAPGMRTIHVGPIDRKCSAKTVITMIITISLVSCKPVHLFAPQFLL